MKLTLGPGVRDSSHDIAAWYLCRTIFSTSLPHKVAVIPALSISVRHVAVNTNGAHCVSLLGMWVLHSLCSFDASRDSWSGDSTCSCSLSSGLQVLCSLSPVDLHPELWGQSSTCSDSCLGFPWVLCSPWGSLSVSAVSSRSLALRIGDTLHISESMVLVQVSRSTPWVSHSLSWSVSSTSQVDGSPQSMALHAGSY